METEGQVIVWGTLKGKFLQKYFLVDLKRKKEMKFLRLEQGYMSVGEYAAKFEEFARFCPYSELEVDGRSKCSKFESGLRPKMKTMFMHQEIANFDTLVNKCRMYENDLKADEMATPKSIPPKNFGSQRNLMQGRANMGGSMRDPFVLPLGMVVSTAERHRTTSRVYTMSGAETSDVDGLTQGIIGANVNCLGNDLNNNVNDSCRH
ncbi:hypothetical protein Lal_00037745 [Lupinus albus]|nr:hypothetical protein Lal_00037745 [Lupinus albus]